MATKILWSPFNGGGMSDSDQFFSITIPQTPLFDDDHFFSKRMELANFLWQLNFFDCHNHYAEGDQMSSITI